MRRTSTLLLILLGVSLLLIIVDQAAGLGIVRGAWTWLIGPIQHGLYEGGGEIDNFWERLRQAEQLQQENEELRELAALLTAENVQCQEIRRENDALRELLGLRERFPELQYLYAEVIGRDPGGLHQVLRIGWAPQGDDPPEVREGMAVISPAGLVGRITEVYPNAADVLLIIDINSSVSAVIQNDDRPTGVVDGQWQAGTRLRMRFIPQGDLVEEGDWVVTSGLQLPPFEENAFPAGLPIGQVLQIETSADLHQQVELLPAVDFDHLEQVMIVLGPR